MIKKFLSLIMFLFVILFIGCVTTPKFYMKTVKSENAQINNNIKIAVIPENWYWIGSPNFLPRALITEFLDLGFTVVERSQLEGIFKEIKLDLSGAVKDEKTKERVQGIDFGTLDKTSIKKAGELLGVDALLITYIIPTYYDGIDKATFRLVKTENAEVLLSITLINSQESPISVKTIIDTISSNIRQLLDGENKIINNEANLGKSITVNPQITKGENTAKLEKKEAERQRNQDRQKLMSQHYTEAVRFYNSGEYDKAIIELEENLKLDSSHEQTKQLLEKVKLRKSNK